MIIKWLLTGLCSYLTVGWTMPAVIASLTSGDYIRLISTFHVAFLAMGPLFLLIVILEIIWSKHDLVP